METLTVGQNVYLEAGVYGHAGKVVKIRWWGIYVKTFSGRGGRIPSLLLRFGKDGKERGGHPLFEGGPWSICGTFTEAEQAQQRERQPFVAWWKSARYEQRLALVTKFYATLAPALRSNFAPAAAVVKIADISWDEMVVYLAEQLRVDQT
jgi:hypothetical protein